MANPIFLTPMGQYIYFNAVSQIAAPGSHGSELWKTDGTDAGTVEVKDIVPGTDSSIPMNLTAVNGQLFFAATGGASIGIELYASDGTEPGTRRVRDINTGAMSSGPKHMRNLNGKLMFVASTGTAGNTEDELWTSDGTEGGTTMVKDIWPGTGGDHSSNPDNLVVVGNLLFFTANDGTHGDELWKSDGTADGTVMVKDIWNDADGGANPINLTNVNGTLYFSAADHEGAVEHGYELWKSDGTSAGTQRITDLNDWNFYDGGPYGMTYFKGMVYFTILRETIGWEVWRTDGTEAGTVQFTDINPSTDPDYFIKGCNPTDFVAVNDSYLFFVANDNVHGREVWMTDGTTQGTMMVADIYPGADIFNDPFPTFLTGLGSNLYFSASDGVHGRELWKVGFGKTVQRDFNGDSKADILWRHNTTGQLFMWLMDGINTIGYASPGMVSDLNWQIQQVGDFNGDSKADILWRHNTTGQLFLWLMDGTSIIGYASPGTISDLSWQIQKVGDFNGDSKADILWRHSTTGQLFMWLMDGINTIGYASPGIVSDLHWQIQQVGDFNGDSRADILWRHNTTGQLFIWLMDGINTIGYASPGMVSDLNWQIQQVGDFNGDSRADILWRHNTTGQLFMWLMDGINTIGYASPGMVSDLNWQIQQVGDFNGDSRADILWRHNTTGQLFMWLMDGFSIIGYASPGIVSDLGWQIQK